MILPDDKHIIDLEHREERRKSFDEHRRESDSKYALKDYEKAVKWVIVTLATGIFLGITNSFTGGVIKTILSHL